MSNKGKRGSAPSRYDADFKAALGVLERSAKRAKESARRSCTPLVVWQDGRIKNVKLGTVKLKGRK